MNSDDFYWFLSSGNETYSFILSNTKFPTDFTRVTDKLISNIC